MIEVTCAVEGETDVPVAQRLLSDAGLVAGPFANRRDGKSQIDERLPGWNDSAVRLPWLVIRDLDQDDADACLPGLRASLLGDASLQPGMCFRFAVRSIESWLLADHEGFTDYFRVSGRLPDNPDELGDPKTELINRCRRSRLRDIREGVPPHPRSGRRLGPEYVAITAEYCGEHWNPGRARERSPSLDRALRDLARLRTWLQHGSPPQ